MMQFFKNDQSRLKQVAMWGADGVLDYTLANGIGTVIENTFQKIFPIEKIDEYATSELLIQTFSQIAVSTIIHTFLKRFADINILSGGSSILTGGSGGSVVIAYALWSAQPNLKKRLDKLTGITKYVGYIVIAFIIANIVGERLILQAPQQQQNIAL